MAVVEQKWTAGVDELRAEFLSLRADQDQLARGLTELDEGVYREFKNLLQSAELSEQRAEQVRLKTRVKDLERLVVTLENKIQQVAQFPQKQQVTPAGASVEHFEALVEGKK